MSRWRKSSHSNDHQGACIELADLDHGVVGLRDSKAPATGHLTFPTSHLALLLERVRHEASDGTSQ
ncbi:DUF397 domain-containing protein [Spirillospora sp. NPDC049652]